MRLRPLRILNLLAALLIMSAAAAQIQVRVLLEETGPLALHIPEGHTGLVDGVVRFHTGLPLNWPVYADGNNLVIDGAAIGRTLTMETDSGFVSWSGELYRGAISLVARDSVLLVVNRLDLEDYLRGVVPAEMQASWPQEALKAQAIAARSYVLNSLEPLREYDICATTHCQVYRGTALENPLSDQAIADTRGLVLTYGGTFARTYYHSDSGGVLASSSEVWGEDLPYLQARSDVHADTPHRRWSQRIDAGQLAGALRAAGVEIGTPTGLTILSFTSSGRVHGLQVQGTTGTASFSGNETTALLRGIGLKSTRMTVTGPLTVSGDGWGHGVGMSQYGARTLAQAGHDFDEILAFYYPSTQLSRLSVVGQAD